MSEGTELVVNGHDAAVTISTTNWTREQIDLIKATVAKGTTDNEFALFMYVSRRTGLDPLARQIHAVKRWSAAEGRETMSIQTGIDGYRLTAARTEQHMGTEDAVFDREDAEYPNKASVTVYRLVNGVKVPFTASARWSEYVQTKKDGSPNSFWQRMPYGMLGKCAEALALRKAFPAELAGLYTHEEMGQASNEPLTSPRDVTPSQAQTSSQTQSSQAATPSSQAQPTEQRSTAGNSRLITKGQSEILLLSQRRSKVSDVDFKTYLADTYRVTELREILQKDVNKILEWLEFRQAARLEREEQEAEEETQERNPADYINQGQIGFLMQTCKECGVSEEILLDYLKGIGIESRKDILKKDLDDIAAWVRAAKKA